ncbi:MAG: site-2 protease family protein [Deltaproteobacteria bacterium]|nr:site-2 protease family protein [Deltaproteobacteria bacterium]
MDDQLSSDASLEKKKNSLPYLHIFLFIITVITTLIAGALQEGVNLLEQPSSIWRGMPFSFTLLLILGTHELGHYVMSNKHQVDVTLPYFIPAPSFIGTFGAVIKMKSPMLNRRTLLDVGVAGPFAGMIVAIPILVIGLILSDVVSHTGEEGIRLGSCILFSLLNWMVHGPMPDNASLMLHPVAFSGWIGLLVTSLNLIPVGQLDGGHIAYAVLGSKQRIVAKMFMGVLLLLGVMGWSGWLVWFVLLLFLGIHHPPVVYDWIPLDRKRKITGAIALGVFVITFMPKPF